MFAAYNGSIIRMQKVPHEDKRIITPRCEHASSGGVPFYTVDSCRVASKFEKGLSWLADVKNADQVRIGGEGGKEMRIMRRCGKAKEWRCIRHGLLRLGGRHAPACWRAYAGC